MTAFDEDGAAGILSDSGRGMEMQRIETGAAGQMWEADRIIVCGGNGAGKSTLGRKLAEASGYQFRDIEDYYFPETGSAYPYAAARTKEEVSRLLLEDMRKYPYLILASVKGDYGKEVESLFTRAMFISVPKDIRMERVKSRSFRKFGGRVLPGGDLYEKEEAFFMMVENRPAAMAENWLASVSIPVMRVDGTESVSKNVEKIIGAFHVQDKDCI